MISLETKEMYGVISGAKNISEFLGCHWTTFHEKYKWEMYEYGLLWRESKKKTAPWATTPYLIQVFLVLRARRRMKEWKAEQAKRRAKWKTKQTKP